MMQEDTGKALLFSRDSPLGQKLSQALLPTRLVITSCDREALLGRVEELSPHAVILDVDAGGLDLFSALHDHFPAVPVVLLNGHEQSRIDAVKGGAAESLPRDVDIELLAVKVGRLVTCELVRKRLERTVQRSKEKIAELEHAIQMVAHDLKSPVVAIEGFVRLLEKRYSQDRVDARRDEILQNLAKASKSVQELLWDFYQLLVSEKVEMQWARIPLTRLVQEVVDQHSHVIEEKKIAVRLDSDDPVAEVMGDRHRVSQVLDNLIVNAVNHMGRRSSGQIRIRLESGPDFTTTSVSDNGVGIPHEYRDKVFARFFRLPRRGRAGGTGLGLAIARTIVEKHGGKIWCESARGGGATFSFTLPRSRP
jgi:signal transduction histidine kinase